MSQDTTVMRWADRVLTLVVPEHQRAVIIGDLRERAHQLEHDGHHGKAAWWYVRQATSVALHFSRMRAARRLGGGGRARPRAGDPVHTRREWGMLHDLRFSIRSLRRRPAFSFVVIATLAIGVGANTAIFTVVRNVVLRPAPYPDPDRLVSLWMEFRREDGVTGFEIVASEPEYVEFAGAAHSFEAIAGFWTTTVNLSGAVEPVRVRAAGVSANFFDVVGIAPDRGRPFLPGEDLPGSPRVVVLSNGLWERAFGGDPDLLGHTIVADGRSYEVVGIMPPDFVFPGGDVDLLRPNYLDPANLAGRSSHYLQLLGRLDADATVATAQAEASVLNARFGSAQPDLHGLSPRHPMVLSSYQARLTGPVRPALWLLTGAAALVLLIACANVANLMYARSEARGHELAIRQALGARRGRLVRSVLMDGALLSAVGAGAGLMLSTLAVPSLASLGADYLPRNGSWRVDGVVVAFAAGLAIVTALVFGLAPAWRGSRHRQAALGKRGGRMSPARTRIRNGLLVSQLALAVTLLIGAGVLVRNLQSLMRIDPGFDPDGVVTMTFELDGARYPSQDALTAFHRRLDERLRAFPSIVGAGAIRSLPLATDGGYETVAASGARVDQDESVNVLYQVASPGYFRALSVPLIAGRLFGDADRAGTEPVVVINRAMADRYWPAGDAIGQRVQLGMLEPNPNPAMRIVGVVGNVIHRGLARGPTPQIFAPRAQAGANYNGAGTRTATLVVKGTVAPSVLIEQVRTAFRELDPTIPLSDIRTMRSVVARSVSDERFLSTLLSVFSSVALALAAIGVYGLMSYLVVQRTHEIGVRMALGATRRQVVGAVVRRSLVVTAIGGGLGLVAALGASRLLDTLVTRGDVHDPLVFVAGPIVLLATAGIAAYGPARRAAGVDPMLAVRSE